MLWNARKACNSQQMKAKISLGNVAEERPTALEHLLTEQKY